VDTPQTLLFEAPERGTEDLDEIHIAGAITSKAPRKVKDAMGSESEVTDRQTGR
jgi:hypothetical protein